MSGFGDRSRPAVEPERDLHLVHRQLRLLQEQPTQLEGEELLAHCCAILFCCLGGTVINLVGQLTKELLAPSETKSQRFFTECSPPQPFTAQHVPEGKVKTVYF